LPILVDQCRCVVPQIGIGVPDERRDWKPDHHLSIRVRQCDTECCFDPIKVGRCHRWRRYDTSRVAARAESAPAKRGEPVAVYLRSGHIIKVGRGFDEEALARVVADKNGYGIYSAGALSTLHMSGGDDSFGETNSHFRAYNREM
jgi:hypothetical protein